MNQQQDKQKEAMLQHAQLFRDALERAMRSPSGTWVNSQSATPPKFFERQGKISAFSSLLMAMHSQLRSCPTNMYISYSDSVSKGYRFGDYNAGIQIPYIRQDGYRNRLSGQTISEEQFKTLSRDESVSYRPNFQRRLRMLYNLDQTDMPQKYPEAYGKLRHSEGPEIHRVDNAIEHECDILQDFDDDCAMYERYVVPMEPTDEGRTQYDAQRDTISIAGVCAYPSTDEYLQDGYRALAAATAHPTRLDRNVSTEEAALYEKLVQECISAMCMVKVGRPGAISSENMELIPKWMDMLAQNPRMVYNLERDVNLANELMIKARSGEKVTKELKPSLHQGDMPIDDMLALKDILSYGGMVFNPINYSSADGMAHMLYKYGLNDLHQQIEQCHSILRDNEALKADGQTSEDTYMRTKSEIYKELSKLGSEMSSRIVDLIPRPWDYYGRRYISNEIDRLVLDPRKELVLIKEPDKQIVNVLLPSQARHGGTVTTATGEKASYWLDPLEQLTPQELEGATIVKNDPDWCDKEKVAQAIKEQYGAKYVRFFETEGPLGFYPPNDYYIGKDMNSSMVLDGGDALKTICRYDLDRIIRDTCAMDFESISVIKDENNRWAMNMQTTTKESLSVYPSQEDLKIFFEQCRDLTEDSLATKKRLAQKYYSLTLECPEMNVDIFNQVPEGVDPDCIENVYIFKDPKFNINMIKAQIRGVGPVQARPISKSQFQKIWIAPDVNRYRKALACRVFADLIPRQYDKVPMIDYRKLQARDSFVGEIDKPYTEQIIGLILSEINTPENNRNFRPNHSQSSDASKEESESMDTAQNQAQEQAQTQSKGKGKNKIKDEAKTQDQNKVANNDLKSEEPSKSQNQKSSPNLFTEPARAQEEGMEETAPEGQRYQGEYVKEEDDKSELSSDINDAETQTQTQSSTDQNQENVLGPVSYSDSSKENSNNKVKEATSTYQASAEYAGSTDEEEVAQKSAPQTQSHCNISVSHTTNESMSEMASEDMQKSQLDDNEPVQMEEQSRPDLDANETIPSSTPTDDSVKEKDSNKETWEDMCNVTLSVEFLNQHKALRRLYPDAFIMISEDGKAKALHDDAFLAYDVIHDGHPIIFVQHPLSESKKDKIPVFQIPESQVEEEVPKLMKRNTTVIYCRLADVLNKDNDQNFQLSL